MCIVEVAEAMAVEQMKERVFDKEGSLESYLVGKGKIPFFFHF